jgi:hypothetical protein
MQLLCFSHSTKITSTEAATHFSIMYYVVLVTFSDFIRFHQISLTTTQQFSELKCTDRHDQSCVYLFCAQCAKNTLKLNNQDTKQHTMFCVGFNATQL